MAYKHKVISRKTNVKVVDHGWMALLKDFRELDGAFTKVGFPWGVEYTYPETGASLQEVAAANELGTDNIPARSFLGSSFDMNRRELTADARKALGAILDQRASVKQGMEHIGEGAEKIIRERIIELDTPPNAPRTIAKKGRDDPLVDTGVMRDMVTHRENR